MSVIYRVPLFNKRRVAAATALNVNNCILTPACTLIWPWASPCLSRKRPAATTKEVHTLEEEIKSVSNTCRSVTVPGDIANRETSLKVCMHQSDSVRIHIDTRADCSGGHSRIRQNRFVQRPIYVSNTF